MAQFDEFAQRRDKGISDLIPGFKGVKIKLSGKEIRLGSKASIVTAGRALGDVWFEKANAIASNARRGFFTERSYKRLAEVYQTEVFTRGLADALGSLPEALANSDYGTIVRTATLRAGRGDEAAVRALKTELTKDAFVVA